MKYRKAFVVRGPGADYDTVIYAETRSQAIMEAGYEDSDDYTAARCKRAKKLDAYEPSQVTPLLLISLGFQPPCPTCQKGVEAAYTVREGMVYHKRCLKE